MTRFLSEYSRKRAGCRNILVCDSTEEAKQLSWGQGGERHKVATLEGTLFAKAGTITGGMAGNLLGRSQRWGDKEYETLKKVCCLPARCVTQEMSFGRKSASEVFVQL